MLKQKRLQFFTHRIEKPVQTGGCTGTPFQIALVGGKEIHQFGNLNDAEQIGPPVRRQIGRTTRP